MMLEEPYDQFWDDLQKGYPTQRFPVLKNFSTMNSIQKVERPEPKKRIFEKIPDPWLGNMRVARTANPFTSWIVY